MNEQSQFAAITAGIDVQDNFVEIEVVGWDSQERPTTIDKFAIIGQFPEAGTQAQVDASLRRGTSGASLATCIDAGGHYTQAVCEFCDARKGLRVWPVKGYVSPCVPVWAPHRSERISVVGMKAARDLLRARAGIEPSDSLVYAYAALCGVVRLGFLLGARANRLPLVDKKYG